MTIYILTGDCRDVLRTLPDKTFHTCVTSPPYFGLRDYGTAEWKGGNAGCDHKHETKHQAQGATSARAGRSNIEAQKNENFRDTCRKCGARRIDRQMGLEPTPDEYVAEMVKVFREVRRVLRDDGTVWLNLGDSYAGYHGNKNASIPTSATNGWTNGTNENKRGDGRPQDIGLKQKDLIGIPWRVAFALQADGWYLRQDIIWHKPNPMPESCKDRCTKAHEYLFLLSKRPRYHFDHEAMKEPGVCPPGTRGAKGSAERAAQPGVNARPPEYKVYDGMRNRRLVWTVTTKPFKEAHFATFPPDLIEPCILAGCPAQCCRECGTPYERQTESTTTFQGGSGRAGRTADEVNSAGKWAGKQHGKNLKLGPVVTTKTIGFAPACDCDAAVVPGEVLDPFAGAGTTGLVARRLGRDATLIELNPEYSDMAEARIEKDAKNGRKTAPKTKSKKAALTEQDLNAQPAQPVNQA